MTNEYSHFTNREDDQVTFRTSDWCYHNLPPVQWTLIQASPENLKIILEKIISTFDSKGYEYTLNRNEITEYSMILIYVEDDEDKDIIEISVEPDYRKEPNASAYSEPYGKSWLILNLDEVFNRIETMLDLE